MRNSITKSSDFTRILGEGQMRINPYLIIRSLPGKEGRRLGIIASNRIGNAVTQNRLKRVLRAAFWELAPTLPNDTDYIVIARRGLVSLDKEGGMVAVKRQLERLLKRQRRSSSMRDPERKAKSDA